MTKYDPLPIGPVTINPTSGVFECNASSPTVAEMNTLLMGGEEYKRVLTRWSSGKLFYCRFHNGNKTLLVYFQNA